MTDYIFPILFIMFAVFSLFLSMSKKNYQKLIKNNGEKFANQIIRYLKICGYLLLICAVVWIGINIL